MTRIAIFASGSGSNAENIIKDFTQNHPNLEISTIISNKETAFVHERAKKLGVKSRTFTAKQFVDTDDVICYLQKEKIDFIVLAGFLLKVPENIIRFYPFRIINIHPALLPNYGGKGMYGDNVHKAVVEAQEKESGITIHYVDQNYDEGDIIFQATCLIDSQDTHHQVAEKVHALEYQFFPDIIARVIDALPYKTKLFLTRN